MLLLLLEQHVDGFVKTINNDIFPKEYGLVIISRCFF